MSAIWMFSAPYLPVILVSGSPKEKVAEMFAAQPYDAFLAKPFTFAERKTTLDNLASPR